jgi:RimJ/RimL family protein N-acetyltransferase
MQNVQLKPVTPSDFPTILQIQNAASPIQLSLEQFLEREHNPPNDQRFLERLLVTDSERPVGMVSLFTHGFIRPNWAQVSLLVQPESRGQGYGGAIWQKFQPYFGQHALHGVEVQVEDSDPKSRAFAEKHGFEVYAHRFSSQLNLLEFDLAAFQTDLVQPSLHKYRIEQECRATPYL